MASFYAELAIEGSTYPVRHCEFEFSQTTDARGRVNAKVRHDLLHFTLDVPDDDRLLAWAAAPHKPLAGHVTFFDTDRRTARETLRFAAGQCVGYREEFVSGDGGTGAYVCQLVITSDGLTVAPGGAAGAYVAAAAKEYVGKANEKILPKWKGGKGPEGNGESTGRFSGRQFDLENCGGPIIKASWQDAVITLDGIVMVKTHISRYGEDPENEAMVERLLKIKKGTLAASDWDKRFYTHEIREYQRYQALGVPDGVDPGRETWNNAHTATLEDYELSDYASDGTHNLYHPEI